MANQTNPKAKLTSNTTREIGTAKNTTKSNKPTSQIKQTQKQNPPLQAYWEKSDGGRFRWRGGWHDMLGGVAWRDD